MEFLKDKPQPDGDYVVFRSEDTPEARADADRSLYYQGCRRIRFVTMPDGRLQAHGYLRAIA